MSDEYPNPISFDPFLPQRQAERIAKLEAENGRLRDCLEECMYQFAYDCVGPCLFTGSLSVLEAAFELLGWENPHEIPELKCHEPDCFERVTCGAPTADGYIRTCYKHWPMKVASVPQAKGPDVAK